MREAIFIFVVVFVLLALTAIRYRKQIVGMLQVWRMLKSMRQMPRANGEQVNGQDDVSKGPLVNCAKCGTWVPESRSIRLGTKTFYCSAACVEKEVEVN